MDMVFWEWVFFLVREYGGIFLRGAGVALFLAVIGTFLGTVLGCLGCVLAAIPVLPDDGPVKKGASRFLRWFIAVYVWLFRGTPMMVQAMVIYYGATAFFQWDLNPVSAGLFVVSVNTGAYMVESMRGGIQSVDPGQMEGAEAVGMNYFQAMRLVILPQAFRNVIPQIGNFLISNVKDTSILSIITVNELFYSGREAAGKYFRYFESFFIVCVIYLVLTSIMTIFLKVLEKRISGSKNYELSAIK